MEPRKLTKEELVAAAPWIATLTTKTTDYSEAEIAGMLSDKFEEKAKEPVHAERDFVFIMNRAKSDLMTYISGMGKLNKYFAIIIGPAGIARDGNADDVKKVQEEAIKGGTNKVYAMATAKQVAAIMVVKDTKDGPKDILTPVRKLLAPMVKTKDGKGWEVQRWLDKAKTKPGFELWQNVSDPVVPLDTKKQSRFDEKKENTDLGRDLRPNWSVSLHCIVWEDGSEVPRYAQFSIYGEDANPDSKTYILNKLEVDNMYKVPVTLKCDENDKKTTDKMMVLKPGSGNKYVIKKMKQEGFDFYNVLNGKYPVIGMPQWTGNPFDKVMPKREIVLAIPGPDGKPMNVPFVPPVVQVDLANIREYHEKFQMKLDDKMEPVLNTKGKHKDEAGISYDQIAYIECTIALKKEPDPESEGSIIVEVKDNSLADGKFSSFLPRMYHTLPFTKDVADAGMFVTTKKSADYYDKDLHTRVKDDGQAGPPAGTRGEIGMSAVNLFVIEERDLPDDEKKAKAEAADKKDEASQEKQADAEMKV
jgi:hypothetical protein